MKRETLLRMFDSPALEDLKARLIFGFDDLGWRDYGARQFFRSPWLDISVCRTWWLGWQYWREYTFPQHHLGLCIVPGLMFVVKWRT